VLNIAKNKLNLKTSKLGQLKMFFCALEMHDVTTSLTFWTGLLTSGLSSVFLAIFNRIYSEFRRLVSSSTIIQGPGRVYIPAAHVRFARRAEIVSLALRSSNSRTATFSSDALSPSSENRAKSRLSNVAWLEDRSKFKNPIRYKSTKLSLQLTWI